MRDAARWRFPWLPDGDDPSAIPIVALLFYELGFIAWVFGFLAIAVASELGHTDLATADRGLYPILGFLGGALPIFAAYAISTNRRYAARLSLVAIVGIMFCVGVIIDWRNAELSLQIGSLCAALVFIGFSGWIIFFSRQYKSRWRESAGANRASSNENGYLYPRLNAFLRRWDVMSFLEHLVVVVILLMIMGGWKVMETYR